MEQDQFELVEAILSEGYERDSRVTALELMRSADKLGMGDLAIRTIMCCFSLRDQAIKEWYIEKRKREAKINV